MLENIPAFDPILRGQLEMLGHLKVLLALWNFWLAYDWILAVQNVLPVLLILAEWVLQEVIGRLSCGYGQEMLMKWESEFESLTSRF